MKKSILIVDHDSKNSGSTVSLKYIVKRLKDNFNLILVTTKDDIQSFDKNDFKEIKKISPALNLNLHFTADLNLFSIVGFYSFALNFFRIIKGIIVALKIISNFNPDLIFVNEYVLLQFNIAAKIKMKPNFCFIRSIILNGTFGMRQKVSIKILNVSTTKIIAISSVEASQFGNSKKVLILNEFLDKDDFTFSYDSNNINDDLTLLHNKTVVIMVGGISYIKGTLIYLNAVNKFDFSKSKICFILIGESERTKRNLKYYDKCKEILNDPKLASHLIHIPFVLDIRPYISISDILVSTSIQSHFSRPIIEAWAQKKTVIASDILHHKTQVADNYNGLLFENENYLDLFSKIQTLLSDNEKMVELGTNGYKTAIKKYNQSNLENLYYYIDKLI